MTEPATSWTLKKLGNLISLDYGRALAAGQRSGTAYPVYGSSGEVGKNDSFIVEGPGIIVGRKGTVGAVTWSQKSFWPIDTTYFVRWLNEASMDRRWTYWRLSHLPLRRLDSSTGVPGLNRTDVYDIAIPVPSVEEQRKIAEILDTVEEAIRSTERLIAKLEKTEQGVLRDLLTRGVDEFGGLGAPRTQSDMITGDRIATPRHWRKTYVGEAGEVWLGRQRSPQHEYGKYMMPYLRVANVFNGFIDYSDIFQMNFTPREQQVYGLETGDILLNEGQSLELVGRCAIYDGQPGKFCFQNTLIRYRCSSALLPEFAQATFRYWLDLGRFMGVAKQTTSIAHLGADRFAQMEIAIPHLNEQRRIVGTLTLEANQLSLERQRLVKLRSVKSALMDDLLTGRVRVDVSEEAEV